MPSKVRAIVSGLMKGCSRIGILSTSDGADAEALRKLFARVDVNADGVIDWNEFVSYMLLDKKSSAQICEPENTPKLAANPLSSTLTEKQVSPSGLDSDARARL